MDKETTRKRGATHVGDTYTTPSDTILTLYDFIEIQDHRHLNNQTTYRVTQWSPEILTQEQINVCTIEGFQLKHIHLITHQTGIPTYEVQWQPAWQLESTIIESESGPNALARYKKDHKPREERKDAHPKSTQRPRKDGDPLISPSPPPSSTRI